MPRGDQLSRQWQLVRLLSSGRYGRTLAQLRAELGVTKRTVQRDIATLERARFPIISEQRNGTIFWRFIDGFSAQSPVSLTLAEQMALYFSRGLFRPLEGTPIYESLESAIQKIGTSLQPASIDLIRKLDSAVSIRTQGWKDYQHSRQVLDTLTKATLHRYTMKILHATFPHKRAIMREVDPYRVWYVNDGLYLVAHDHHAGDLRVFAIERISQAQLTNRRFRVPENFDFNRITSSAFKMIWGDPQHVEIRFSPSQAPYILERTWHPSQTVTKEHNGSVVLKLEVADLGEVKRWLFGFGADATVLKPMSLRKQIAREAARLVRSSRRRKS